MSKTTMDEFGDWMKATASGKFPVGKSWEDWQEYTVSVPEKKHYWKAGRFEAVHKQLEEALGTKHRKPVKGDDGSWACSECGAESFDRDQFEEAADFMKCPGKSLTDVVESDKVAKQIQSVRAAMKNMGDSATKTASKFDELGRVMASIGTHNTPAVMDVPAELMSGIKLVKLDENGNPITDSSGLLMIPTELSFKKC